MGEEEEDTFEFDHMLDKLVFDRFQSNVLTYICGWVVRKACSLLKCSKCRHALVKVPETTNSDFILLRLRDNGGLLYPNEDVRKVIFMTEKVLKHEDSVTKINKSKLTLSVLRYLQLYDLFRCEGDHFDETSTIWSNHLLSLVKLLISVYIDLRLHHAAKQWNLSTADRNVRQLLTKTVIFRHQ